MDYCAMKLVEMVMMESPLFVGRFAHRDMAIV